jgi:predicted transcriptional regulator
MKKLFITSLLLVSVLSFSQENKKNPHPGSVDKRVNIIIDSLSKKYKKNILGYVYIVEDGKKNLYVTYTKKGKLFQEKIKN